MNESIISFSGTVCRVVCEESFFHSHHFIWIRGDRRVGRCQCPARPFGRCSALPAFLLVVDGEEEAVHQSPLLEALFFVSIEDICLRAPQIDGLWATISIFLLDGALVIMMGSRFQGLHRSHSPLRGATVSLFTYVHIGVTGHTLATTFFTQSSGVNTSLLAAKDQVQTSAF